MQVDRQRLTAALVGGLLTGLAVGACGSGGSGGSAAEGRAPSTVAPENTTYIPTGASTIPQSVIAVTGLGYVAQVKPSTLVIASDGTLARLRWSAWGGKRATATGTLEAKVCSTDCAASRPVPYAATVVLSDPVTCENRRYYNVATATIKTTQGPRQWGSFLHAPCKLQPLITG
jgi:hypothetical protein